MLKLNIIAYFPQNYEVMLQLVTFIRVLHHNPFSLIMNRQFFFSRFKGVFLNRNKEREKKQESDLL